MKNMLLIPALLLCAFTTKAQTAEAKAFYSAADEAAFYCQMDSHLLENAIEYKSPKEDENSKKLLKCISDKGAALTEAFKLLPSTEKNSDLRISAKAVYSAWLTYSSVLLTGLTPDEVKTKPEALAFRKAMSDYKTEMVLAGSL